MLRSLETVLWTSPIAIGRAGDPDRIVSTRHSPYFSAALCFRSEADAIIEELMQRIKEMEAQLRTANDLVTCCCGTPMKYHGDGHNPISMYHHSHETLKTDNRRLRETLTVVRMSSGFDMMPKETKTLITATLGEP